MISTGSKTPFKMKKLRFLLLLAFSITINKAQGLKSGHIPTKTSKYKHQYFVTFGYGTTADDVKVFIDKKKRARRRTR